MLFFVCFHSAVAECQKTLFVRTANVDDVDPRSDRGRLALIYRAVFLTDGRHAGPERSSA